MNAACPRRGSWNHDVNRCPWPLDARPWVLAWLHASRAVLVPWLACWDLAARMGALA